MGNGHGAFPFHIILNFTESCRKLKGPETATIDIPPNDPLFDLERLTNPRHNYLVDQQQRLLNANKTTIALDPSITTFLQTLLRPLANIQNRPAPAAPAITPDTDALIPGNLKPGANMSIQDFCARFELPSNLRDKLLAAGFIATRAFTFSKVSRLIQGGLLEGDIAELQSAITEWAKGT